MTYTELLEALKSDPIVLTSGTLEFIHSIGFFRHDKNGNTVLTKQGKLFLRVMREGN